MKPVAMPVDAERKAVDLLTLMLSARGEAAEVGISIPKSWTRDQTEFVQVALDGTPEINYPALFRSTIRVTTWSSSATEAKRLASLCLALLASYPGDREAMSIRPLTGLLPAVDPDTKADLASITVQFNLRGTTV